MPIQQALQQLNLIRNGNIEVAVLLLFGKDPARLMPQSALRCARFKGDDTIHSLDMKVIEGSVMDQFEETMAFVQRNTSMAVKIEGKPERTEQWEYPLDGGSSLRDPIYRSGAPQVAAKAGRRPTVDR